MRCEGRVEDRAWIILVVLYVSGILSANALAAKLINVFGVAVTAGAVAIPLVYLTTDLLNELYGPEATRQVVWMGFSANAVLVAMTFVCSMPPASDLGASQAQFDAMFSITPRVVLGSMAAYLCSSLADVRMFHWLRRVTGGEHFWLRKNGSTVVSQLLDTAIFVAIAFGGVIPLGALVPMALGQYVVKISAAPLGTPLSYAILRITCSGTPERASSAYPPTRATRALGAEADGG